MMELDLSGLKCPLPVLRTRKALRSVPAGTLLRVICTDPLCFIDIPNLVRETGDALVSQSRDGAATVFTIRRCGTNAHEKGPVDAGPIEN